MSSRSRRMTKKQKVLLVEFIEANSIIRNAVTSHIDLEVVNEKWRGITITLNNHGPTKTVKQWKEAFGELKTKTKKKARELLYDVQGTGGGPATKKPLTELEERLLRILCQTVITGVPDIPEPGINDNVEIINPPVICPNITIEDNSTVTEVQKDSTAEVQHISTETFTRPRSLQKCSTLQNLIKDHSRLVEELNQGNLMVAQGLIWHLPSAM